MLLVSYTVSTIALEATIKITAYLNWSRLKYQMVQR